MAKNNAVITTTLLYCWWWHLVLMDSYFELSSLSSMKADHWKKMEIVLYFVSIKIRCCLWGQYFFLYTVRYIVITNFLKILWYKFLATPNSWTDNSFQNLWTLKKRNRFFLLTECLHTLTQADSCVPVNVEKVLAKVFYGSLPFCLCLHCLCIVPYLSMC